MNIVTEEMRNKLREPLPPEAITPHPTKSYLSSIKAIYVVERLNTVFGIGSWQLRSEMVERPVDTGTVVTKTILSIPSYDIHLESFGGNDNGGANSKNFDLGDAYKGSVTDAITKICSYLEIGIDVFKGKSTGKKETLGSQARSRSVRPVRGQQQEATATEAENPTEAEALPFLTPGNKSWTAAVKRLKEGITIDVVEQHFQLSGPNRIKLIKESRQDAA